MSEWQKVNLGDCCEITSSKRIFFSEYVESGIPFYRSKEIIEKGKGEEISHPLYISKEKYDEIKGKYGVPQKGDLLLTAVGSLGIPFVVKDDSPFYFKDGNLVWLKHFQDIDPIFLYYWIKSENGYNALYNIAIGSAQKALTIAAIKGYEIPLPPLQTQHRIATILSRYDSLIENYQKQIKLLEEAAQRLYKEWFIDLHFPGHEHTKIVDGVPEGWEMKKVGEIAIISAGGDKPDVVTEEQTTECQVPIYSNGTTKEGLYGYTNKSSNTAGSITVSARGSIGFACLRMHDYFSIVRLISIKPQNNVDLMYLFQFTKVHTFMSNGAAQQQLTVPMVKAIDVVYPAESLLEAFENVVLPLYKKVQSLQSQLRLLTEARDRLLPKLMSGEIAI